MRIIDASDIHIHTDTAPYIMFDFAKIVAKEEPDLLVLNGDIADPWKSTWNEILKSSAWKILQGLVGMRTAKGLRTVYINRNHDYNAKPEYLVGAELTPSLKVDNYLFVHGWEFDLSWNPFVAPIAFAISKYTPKLMLPIYNALFPSCSDEKNHSGEMCDDWNLHVGMIHLRAMQYAKANDLKVFIGHTHNPLPFNGLIADSGDMVDSFSYLEIEDGKVELRFL